MPGQSNFDQKQFGLFLEKFVDLLQSCLYNFFLERIAYFKVVLKILDCFPVLHLTIMVFIF